MSNNFTLILLNVCFSIGGFLVNGALDVQLFSLYSSVDAYVVARPYAFLLRIFLLLLSLTLLSSALPDAIHSSWFSGRIFGSSFRTLKKQQRWDFHCEAK